MCRWFEICFSRFGLRKSLPQISIKRELVGCIVLKSACIDALKSGDKFDGFEHSFIVRTLPVNASAIRTLPELGVVLPGVFLE